MKEKYILGCICLVILSMLVVYIVRFFETIVTKYNKTISYDEMNYNELEYKYFDNMFSIMSLYFPIQHMLLFLFASILSILIVVYFKFSEKGFIPYATEKLHQLEVMVHINNFNSFRTKYVIPIFIILLTKFVYMVCKIFIFDDYKNIYNLNKNIQDNYNYINIDLINILSENKNNDEKTLIQKWMNDELIDEQERKMRIGTTQNAEDMINKRLEILITYIFYKNYLIKRIKDIILNPEKIGNDNNLDKENLFMYLQKNNNNLLISYSRVMREYHDIYVLLKNDINTDTTYRMDEKNMIALQQKYNTIYEKNESDIINLKKYSDSYLLIQVGFMIDLISIIVYGICLYLILKYFVHLMLENKKNIKN